MKPLRKRLEEEQRKTNLRLEVVQQDYILSWILIGIFEHPSLRDKLVFKGGTALKKCFFGNYRFSEDLDFTALPALPSGRALFNAMVEAGVDIQNRLNVFAPVKVFVTPYRERDPHPQGQEAFKIRTQFPWQREPLTTVMVEISREENLAFSPVDKQILHGYGEALNVEIPTYSLEEIVLEKLRAILQHTKKLYERDWSRSRARDYYDLWRIFSSFEESLHFENFSESLEKKCSPKGVQFEGVQTFFDPIMIRNVLQTWEKWLGPLVRDLPSIDLVLEELREKLTSLFEAKSIRLLEK